MNDELRMTNDELRNNIRKLVAKVIKLPEEKVGFDADLFADLNVDSLVGMEIFASLDKKYGIVIPGNLLPGISTLDDLSQIVARLLEEKGKA